MSSVNNSLSKEKTTIFQTVLSSPGMNQKCKISLMMTRRSILLLSRLIEMGLLSNGNILNDPIIIVLEESSSEEFRSIHTDILKRAELTDFYERLKEI